MCELLPDESNSAAVVCKSSSLQVADLCDFQRGEPVWPACTWNALVPVVNKYSSSQALFKRSVLII